VAPRDEEFMINTRLVMTAAAIFFGLAGAACLFLPDEVLKLYSIDSSSQTADKDICRARRVAHLSGGFQSTIN